MRISMEIFNIPEDAMDQLRRTVYDSYEKFLHNKNTDGSNTILNLRGGSCPLSEKKYMHLDIQTNQSIELECLNRFSESIYASHPLRDDAVVANNCQLKIEDATGHPDPELLPEGIDEEALVEGEISCWVCGRFEGEEYEDFLTNEQRPTHVNLAPEAQVPLCTVCARILHRPSSIE